MSPWQLRAVNEMHDAYADWREETARVRATYAQWSEATAADQAWASTAYVAALDREEAAADRYARVAARVAAIGEALSESSP